MDKLLTLLDVQKQAAQAPDLKSFEFTILNETNKIIPYKQAIFWSKGDFGIKLGGVSGNMSLDENGSYAQWLKTFIKKVALPQFETSEDTSIIVFSHDTIDEAHQKDWLEYAGKHAALMVLRTDKDGILGGLWLERDTPFQGAEQAIMDELSAAYAQSLALLNLRKKSGLLSPWKRLKKHHNLIIIALILISLMPVRLTLTAPAEIIAQNPTVITVPYDGVLDEITVKAGDKVEQGAPLFIMDKTDLDGQIKTTTQALKIAEANLSRLRKESLRTPEKKADLNKLIAEITAKKIENDYAKIKLKQSTITAPVNGVAIFSDADEFEGQPVRTGEKIMVVADPDNIELLIKAPVDNMIPITASSPVSFYLNVSPLNGYTANIISMGYQASPDSDGLLTYKIRARIQGDGNEAAARIGWKGTAKIKGKRTIFAYAVLRRPLITLRKITGL